MILKTLQTVVTQGLSAALHVQMLNILERVIKELIRLRGSIHRNSSQVIIN